MEYRGDVEQAEIETVWKAPQQIGTQEGRRADSAFLKFRTKIGVGRVQVEEAHGQIETAVGRQAGLLHHRGEPAAEIVPEACFLNPVAEETAQEHGGQDDSP